MKDGRTRKKPTDLSGYTEAERKEHFRRQNEIYRREHLEEIHAQQKEYRNRTRDERNSKSRARYAKLRKAVLDKHQALADLAESVFVCHSCHMECKLSHNGNSGINPMEQCSIICPFGDGEVDAMRVHAEIPKSVKVGKEIRKIQHKHGKEMRRCRSRKHTSAR